MFLFLELLARPKDRPKELLTIPEETPWQNKETPLVRRSARHANSLHNDLKAIHGRQNIPQLLLPCNFRKQKKATSQEVAQVRE